MALISITRKADKSKDSKKSLKSKANETIEVGSDEVHVTSAAAKQIVDRAESEGNGVSLLRIAVRGGGCSGLTYAFAFESAPKEKDAVFLCDDARICVDPKSLKVLGGSILDFRQELGRQGFIMRNPQASSSCSCGESFSL